MKSSMSETGLTAVLYRAVARALIGGCIFIYSCYA